MKHIKTLAILSFFCFALMLFVACESNFVSLDSSTSASLSSDALSEKRQQEEKQQQDKYETAVRYMRQSKYEEAILLFNELNDYKDSASCATYCEAITYCEIGDYRSAYDELLKIPSYEKTKDLMRNIYYETRLFEGLSDLRTMLKNPGSLSVTDYHISFMENYNEKSSYTPEKPAMTLTISAQNGFGGYNLAYALLSESGSGKYKSEYLVTTLNMEDADNFSEMVEIGIVVSRYGEQDMINYINEERVNQIIMGGKYTTITRLPDLHYSDFAE